MKAYFTSLEEAIENDIEEQKKSKENTDEHTENNESTNKDEKEASDTENNENIDEVKEDTVDNDNSDSNVSTEFSEDFENYMTKFITDFVTNESQTRLNMQATLSSINDKIEGLLGCKYKAIIPNSDFCFYLDIPIKSNYRSNLLTADVDLKSLVNKLDELLDGDIDEQGKIIGNYKDIIESSSLFLDIPSLISSRHLNKKELKAIIVKYITDSIEYVTNRTKAIDLIKQLTMLIAKFKINATDTTKEQENINEYVKNEEEDSKTTIDDTIKKAIKAILETSISIAYKNDVSNYSNMQLFKDLELSDAIASATNKLSDTGMFANKDHTYCIDALIDLSLVYKIFIMLGAKEQLALDAIINEIYNNALKTYFSTAVNDNVTFSSLVKMLAKDSESRINSNNSLTEELKNNINKDLVELVKYIADLSKVEDKEVTISKEDINIYTSNLSNYNLATELIYIQDFNDPDIKKMEEILGTAMYSGSRERRELGEKLKNLIIKRFGLPINKVDLNGDDFYTLIANQTPSHGMLSFLSLFGKLELENINSGNKLLDQTKKIINNIKESKKNFFSVDLKKAKFIGLTDIFKGGLSIHLNSRDVNEAGLSSREYTASCLHEIGHIFTYFEYLINMNSTNLFLAELTEKILEPNGKYEYIVTDLDKLGIKKMDKGEIEKTLTNPAKRSIFLLSVMYKTYSNIFMDMKNNFMVGTMSEAVADSFASRFGYGKDLALSLDKLTEYYADIANVSKKLMINDATERDKLAIIYFPTLLLIPLLGLIFPLIKLFIGALGSLALAGPIFLVLGILASVIFVIKIFYFLDLPGKTTMQADLSYNSVRRITRNYFELIRILKDTSIPESIRIQTLKDIEVVKNIMEEYLDYVEGKFDKTYLNALCKSTMDLLFTKGLAKSDADLYNLQLELERISNNDLFIGSTQLLVATKRKI